MKAKTKYCYSIDGSNFSRAIDTLEEALAAAKNEITTNKTVFFISKCTVEEFEPKLTADNAILYILDSLKDKPKTHYLEDVSEGQRAELTKKLTNCFNRWAKKYEHSLSWYTLFDTQPYMYKNGEITQIKIPKQ